MENKLTQEDLELILESLRYTKEAFEAYNDYPNKEFQKKRVLYVTEVANKIRAMKKA